MKKLAKSYLFERHTLPAKYFIREVPPPLFRQASAMGEIFVNGIAWRHGDDPLRQERNEKVKIQGINKIDKHLDLDHVDGLALEEAPSQANHFEEQRLHKSRLSLISEPAGDDTMQEMVLLGDNPVHGVFLGFYNSRLHSCVPFERTPIGDSFRVVGTAENIEEQKEEDFCTGYVPANRCGLSTHAHQTTHENKMTASSPVRDENLPAKQHPKKGRILQFIGKSKRSRPRPSSEPGSGYEPSPELTNNAEHRTYFISSTVSFSPVLKSNFPKGIHPADRSPIKSIDSPGSSCRLRSRPLTRTPSLNKTSWQPMNSVIGSTRESDKNIQSADELCGGENQLPITLVIDDEEEPPRPRNRLMRQPMWGKSKATPKNGHSVRKDGLSTRDNLNGRNYTCRSESSNIKEAPWPRSKRPQLNRARSLLDTDIIQPDNGPSYLTRHSHRGRQGRHQSKQYTWFECCPVVVGAISATMGFV